jgi:hypothetical protein
MVGGPAWGVNWVMSGAFIAGMHVCAAAFESQLCWRVKSS